MKLDSNIFKAYDIRGIVGLNITPEFAHQLGCAFGTQVRRAGGQAVVVGRDGRLSGPTLSAALIEGLRASGCDVVDLGQVTTPMVYFATCTLPGVTSGVAITGSHNPPNYNGFKLVLDGAALYGEGVQQLRRLIESQDYESGSAGTLTTLDIAPHYLQRITGDVKLARKMKVVADAGNGVAGATMGPLLRGLGCEVRELFAEVDGSFPNHHPDPADPHNLQDVMRVLRETDAEIGLAFDGDGDRLGVVTKSGQVIWPDRQMMLFAGDVLTRHPGGKILFDVKCTTLLAPRIAAAGGVPLMWKTGHSLVKAKMKEVGSPLGGEMSGHIFFQDRWFGFDDGLYAAARLLEILSRHADASAVLESLPNSLNTPELKLECPAGDHHAIIAQLQREAVFASAKELHTIDGVRAEYADGFGLARASNTTPTIVLRFEGANAAAISRIQDEFRAALHNIVPNAMLPF
jgi:phosphomannomutase/phosphoglucomutase